MRKFIVGLTILVMMAILVTALWLAPGSQQAAYAFSAKGVTAISANPGETITFTGDGAPNTNVNIRISTSTKVDVSGGRYGLTMSNVRIPGSSNGFSISAYPVKTMTVAGNSIGFTGISTVKGIDISGRKGSFSISNVPADNYKVMVYGDANGPQVNIDATASCVVPVDNNGKYSGSVSTSGMPAGVYKVMQDGNLVAVVNLGA